MAQLEQEEVRQRQAWLSQYERGNVTLEGLHEFAPLVAAAVEKKLADEKAAKKKAARKATTKKKAS